MSNTDTDLIILDENPVYANQISEFIQCLNLSCLRFQRPQLYLFPFVLLSILATDINFKFKPLGFCNFLLIKWLIG
jgi:hypothetical protein